VLTRKAKSILIGLLIFFTFMFSFNTILTLSLSQTNGDSLTIYSEFNLIEYGESQGNMINVSTIEYSFPSDSWEITEIELNFTGIKLEREVKVIEDQEIYGQNFIYYNNPSQKRLQLGVQLNISETSTIYGVYIYGKKINGTVTDIKFQINGYDEATNKPNNTIFSQIDLNISINEGWHYQDFSSSPKTLVKGNYSLVMNGTEIGATTDKNSIYYWKFNEIDPVKPNLYISEFENSWSTPEVNSTYLHKLVQKTDKINWPEDIKLQAKINGQNYDISNGSNIGSGNLTVRGLNFSPGVDFEIQIKSTQFNQLIFNLSYFIKTESYLTTQGYALVEGDLENEWTLTPNIQRTFNDYWIEFNYPSSWQNLMVFRRIGPETVKINSEIDIYEINKTIYLPNNTILDGADWHITAVSPNLEFTLNFPITTWNLEQDLQFSTHAPTINGNLTFVLLNPLGFVQHTEVKEISTEETFFSYSIPSNSIEGTYIAKIYWNNETDAGLQSQVFKIISPPVPFTIDPLMLTIIISLIIGISISGGTIFIVVRNFRRRQLEKEEKIYHNCIDILNLDYLMVTDKNSGLNVYTQNFAGKEVDASLISGFLQAIHSFGIELIKVEDRSQTIKLEYKDYIILMSEFVNLRLILMMKESPSRNFLFSLEDLAYDVYKNYGESIDSFNGDVNPFRGIEELLKQHLNISFISPIKIAKIEKLEKVRINQSERLLINKAVILMKTGNKDHFFIRDLIPPKECSPKDIENILNLIDKKVFHLY